MLTSRCCHCTGYIQPIPLGFDTPIPLAFARLRPDTCPVANDIMAAVHAIMAVVHGIGALTAMIMATTRSNVTGTRLWGGLFRLRLDRRKIVGQSLACCCGVSRC